MAVAAILSDVVVWIPAPPPPVIVPGPSGVLVDRVPTATLSISSGGSISRTAPTATLVGVG